MFLFSVSIQKRNDAVIRGFLAVSELSFEPEWREAGQRRPAVVVIPALNKLLHCFESFIHINISNLGELCQFYKVNINIENHILLSQIKY